jgi:outer membrane protein OmpA-like peptidoglycan-associated protein
VNRRNFLNRAIAPAGVLAALGGSLGWTGPVLAQSEVAASTVLAAPKIIQALSAKDIVLDQPGGRLQRTSPSRRAAVIDLQVPFTFDSAQLLGQGKRQLDELAIALNSQTLATAGFLLAGHTDRVGDADYNLKLSLARAEAVKAYLADVHRISPARLQTIGHGYSRLADPVHPTAALNRRVEVRRLMK